MLDKKILIVDDENELLEMLNSIFSKAGYKNVIIANSGECALEKWKNENPDIIILDVMMTGINGFSVLREIRKVSKIPILMLTARDEADDKITGFELGADDYLVKPFLPQELLLRVQAIFNRVYPEKNRIIELEHSIVNLDTAEVKINQNTTVLTAKELLLFEKLAENVGRIVTTGILCQTICGEIWQGYETTLATHIRHLREKIELNPSKPTSLLTVKGLGYKLLTKEC
ncbi:response regulator transcription factor [[Clostridium] innocuum]|nr:response regulator transcription factor [[Clostridium] innocuum]